MLEKLYGKQYSKRHRFCHEPNLYKKHGSMEKSEFRQANPVIYLDALQAKERRENVQGEAFYYKGHCYLFCLYQLKIYFCTSIFIHLRNSKTFIVYLYNMQTINQSLFKENSPRQSESDTGSPESQIALFSHRIKHITTHLQENKKDHASRLSLVKIVQKQKKQLRYLKKENIDRYKRICTNLSLRK